MNSPSVQVFQIYYLPDQLSLLEEGFIPYDNSDADQEKIDQREYAVFLKNFQEGIHLQSDYTGFMSWKFREKAQISGQQFLNFIHQHPGYDVYFLNPFPHEVLLWGNMWVQGEICHPGITDFAQKVFDKLSYGIDLKNLPCTLQTTLFCNYWVGNQNFWHQYMNFTLPIFEYILNKVTEEEKAFLRQKADRLTDAPYFPYIFERLFTTFLLHHPEFKFCSYQYTLEQLLEKYPPFIAQGIVGLQYYEEGDYLVASRVFLETTKDLYKHHYQGPHLLSHLS